MPILFTLNREHGYFISILIGEFSDNELLASYKKYFEGDEWFPGLNELVDLSQIKYTGVTEDGLTSEGLKKLAAYMETINTKYKITYTKVAIYVTEKSQIELERVFDAFNKDPTATSRVFNDIQQAELWLKNTKEK